jgi:hypothetical protein
MFGKPHVRQAACSAIRVFGHMVERDEERAFAGVWRALEYAEARVHCWRLAPMASMDLVRRDPAQRRQRPQIRQMRRRG